MSLTKFKQISVAIIFNSLASLSYASIDIEVYGLHNNVTRQVNYGDTLISGDSFQISLKSTVPQNIFVYLKDSVGNLSHLKPNASNAYFIDTKSNYHYPSPDHWYKLDDATGVETLYFLYGTSKKCNDKLALSLTKENIKGVIESKLCSVEKITFNHILKDISNLISENIRGMHVVSEKEEQSILEKYNVINKHDISTDSLLFSNITSSLPYNTFNTELPKTRGIKEVHLFKEISPSVVLIATKDGVGTGSVINSNGEILTNWHVIKNEKTVGVVFKPTTRRKLNKSDLIVADVIKFDEVRDLALIKVRKMPKSIKAIEFGKTESIDIGEDVHAIGHPKGENWSYTRGYVSSLRNDYEWTYEDKSKHKVNLIIQTQTPINPGNSGGPLLSAEGKLLGVNSFTMDGQGLNYAVSVDDVQSFLKTKINRKTNPLQTNLEKLSEKIGYTVLRVGNYDINGDGVDDYTIEIDVNKNGVMDMRIVRDGKTKKLFFADDLNENGKFERVRNDTDGNGKIDLAIIDTDEDGEFDIVARDFDEDGKFDSYTPM